MVDSIHRIPGTSNNVATRNNFEEQIQKQQTNSRPLEVPTVDNKAPQIASDIHVANDTTKTLSLAVAEKDVKNTAALTMDSYKVRDLGLNSVESPTDAIADKNNLAPDITAKTDV